MPSTPVTVRLVLDVEIEDEDLLTRVTPPAVETSSGGLAAPDDEVRVASVLGILLTGLRKDIRTAAGIEIVGVAAEGLGGPGSAA